MKALLCHRLPFLTCSLCLILLRPLPAADEQTDDGPYLHVWVHYDYMVEADHSDAPSPAAIRMVVDAFKRHGVILHIDPQHTPIPMHEVIVPDWPRQFGWNPGFDDPACTGPDAVRFSDLKAQYFQPSSNHPWHYAVFGEYVFTDSNRDAINCPELSSSVSERITAGMTGFSQVGFLDEYGGLGYNFVVALKGIRIVEPVTDQHEAAIFMHELGHNLGLCHGGPDLDFCAPNGAGADAKPNYLSVMNRNSDLIGIPYASAPGSTDIAGYRLDYSDVLLPDLDEARLDETVGIQDAAHPTDISFADGSNAPVPAWGPFDWNQDGSATDSGLAMDLNADSVIGVLHGADDWTWIHSRLTPPAITEVRAFLGGPAHVGQAVVIEGVNLMMPASVTFAGGGVTVPAVLLRQWDTSPAMTLAAWVPEGARSGHITIVTREGTATSAEILTIVQ